MQTDDRYVDRYHGPDDMVKDKHNTLTEIEAKGTSTGSTTVAKNNASEKQGSAAKNLRRAKQMLKKNKKVGKTSKRQGGAYTQSEQDLWQQIKDMDGQKRHISTHTDTSATSTGRVKVLERDTDGNVIGVVDDFDMENFKEIKGGIDQYFQSLKKINK